jgi:hypothetical protein
VQVRFVHSPARRYVLAHGAWFTPRPLPRRRQGGEKVCYRNAQRGVSTREGLDYVEGFAATIDSRDLVVHHAWAAVGEEVIDPTWDPSGVLYLGVRFSAREAAQLVLDLGRHSAFHDGVLPRRLVEPESPMGVA